MKKTKRFCSALCAALMFFSLLSLSGHSTDAYGATLKEQLAASEAKKAQLQKELDAIKKNKDSALQQKYVLDERNAVIQGQIDLLADRIDELEINIATTDAQLRETAAQEEEQYELFCRQVRQEEERGPLSFWSVLFKASSFADLLSRIDFVNEIMDYDQSVIDTLGNLRARLSDQEAQLQASKTDLEAQRVELKVRQQELSEQIRAAEQVIADYSATQAGKEAMLKAEKAASDALNVEIKRQEEEERKWQEQQRAIEKSYPNVNSYLKSFIWPTTVTKLLTSGYGGRDAPCPGASSNHMGVDIAASRNTSILAVQSGTVCFAGWNGGYGNCVMIEHAMKVKTVYGHMNKISVSVGQSVKQGDVIGLVGSTGVSTGPHIHYEIRINNTPTNPLPYLPGYVRYGW